MQPADRVEFLKIVNGLAAIKPGKPLTVEALDMFWQAMAGWSLEDFKAAANQLARSSEFMPNPYHFEQLRKAGRKTAGEAWAEVLAYVRGGWTRWQGGGVSQNIHVPAPPNPLIERAVAAVGGYRALANTNDDQLPFLERRFATHYADLQDAEEIRDAVPQIAATRETLNRVGGPQSVAQALAMLTRDKEPA